MSKELADRLRVHHSECSSAQKLLLEAADALDPPKPAGEEGEREQGPPNDGRELVVVGNRSGSKYVVRFTEGGWLDGLGNSIDFNEWYPLVDPRPQTGPRSVVGCKTTA